jgi:uncharacterized membrane protein
VRPTELAKVGGGGVSSRPVADVPGLLLRSLLLRPYVFGIFGLYVLAAIIAWGARRALAFTGLAAGLAFGAEFASTRVGVPFGLYHYTGLTRGHELFLANVPFFDPLSFTFLAYASLGLARLVLSRGALDGDRAIGKLGLAATAGVLMMWLDLVIDPLAVRGDRWFLGRLFYYPEPGAYFGVPVANFVGWAVLGTVIAGVWLWLAPRVGGSPPAWAARVPGRAYHAVGLYYLVLVLNVALTGLVAEPPLFWAGVTAHLPLALLVVCCLTGPAPGRDVGEPAS